MAEPLLVVKDLVKTFGALAASDHLSLDVASGELHAVIGPNGAGKTTLAAILTGELAPDRGMVRFDGRDITRTAAHTRVHRGLVRSYQITSIFQDYTVLEHVVLAKQGLDGHSFRFWRPALDDMRLVEPARQVIARIGLAELADRPASTLAHGQQRQLELAMALALKPKLLILDEPMAGMSRAESEEVITLLSGLKKETTILLIEHDMDAVFTLADRITVLVYGRAIATGDAETIRTDAAVQDAYLGDEA